MPPMQQCLVLDFVVDCGSDGVSVGYRWVLLAHIGGCCWLISVGVVGSYRWALLAHIGGCCWLKLCFALAMQARAGGATPRILPAPFALDIDVAGEGDAVGAVLDRTEWVEHDGAGGPRDRGEGSGDGGRERAKLLAEVTALRSKVLEQRTWSLKVLVCVCGTTHEPDATSLECSPSSLAASQLLPLLLLHIHTAHLPILSVALQAAHHC